MDRIIEVKVGGNHLNKDSKTAGVRGEANVANLRITFDSGWDSYTKTITFWNALGGNPVKRTLTTDLLENISKSKRIYLVPIPSEPMTEAGKLTFIIDGYVDGKRQRSISDQLEVKDAPITENAEEPISPTPTQAEQLQGQIDGIISTIQNAVIAGENAQTSEANAKNSADSAEESSNQAKEYAEEAEESSQKAQSAVGKTSYIGANGNWIAWDGETNAWYDTMVKAQAGSTVYVGENPPDDAEVWIDPNGESAIYAPYIGENGNWYTFNPETQTFTDSGNRAVAKDGDKGEKGDKGDTGEKGEQGERGLQGVKGEAGHTPVKGEDYFTDDEKTEIANEVSAEIEAELNAALLAIIAIEEEMLIPDGNEVDY